MFVVNTPDRLSMVIKSFASSWRYNIATSKPARLNLSVIDGKIRVQRHKFSCLPKACNTPFDGAGANSIKLHRKLSQSELNYIAKRTRTLNLEIQYTRTIYSLFANIIFLPES